ncbi:MAG: PorP/SprF family type IX secretion system membrane protein [Flavobacteriales bacterium]
MIKKIAITLTIICGIGSATAQDIHFSQFTENPLLLNPSYAGMYEGNYRFNLNYKNQWATLGNVFETYAASADFILFKNYMGLKSTGIGISAYQDQAGSSNTKTTKVDLNLSQTVYLSDNSDLTLGIGLSYIDMSANYTGLNWGSQYNGVEFNEGILSGENFVGYAEKAFDLSAGLVYRIFDDNLYPLEIGVSAHHLAAPRINILGVDGVIPVKIAVNASKEFNFPNNRNLGYRFLVLGAMQKRAREIVVGGLFRKDFGLVSKYTGYYSNINVYAGVYYRLGDAIIPVVKVTVHKKITVGISYDFTVSNLSQASLYRGGPEFALSYIGPFRPIAVISPKNFD